MKVWKTCRGQTQSRTDAPTRTGGRRRTGTVTGPQIGQGGESRSFPGRLLLARSLCPEHLPAGQQRSAVERLPGRARASANIQRGSQIAFVGRRSPTLPHRNSVLSSSAGHNPRGAPTGPARRPSSRRLASGLCAHRMGSAASQTLAPGGGLAGHGLAGCFPRREHRESAVVPAPSICPARRRNPAPGHCPCARCPRARHHMRCCSLMAEAEASRGASVVGLLVPHQTLAACNQTYPWSPETPRGRPAVPCCLRVRAGVQPYAQTESQHPAQPQGWEGLTCTCTHR